MVSVLTVLGLIPMYKDNGPSGDVKIVKFAADGYLIKISHFQKFCDTYSR